MHRVAALSLRQRSVVILLTLLIAGAGIFSVTRLRSELLPNFELPILTVVTTYPGAGPQAVDEQLTGPIAQILTSIEGIDTTQSTSSEGFSVVVAEFEYGSDMEQREAEIAAAVRNVALPQGAQPPLVERVNLQQFPVIQFSLTSETADLTALYGIANSEFVPGLSGASGVNRVEVVGGTEPQLQILLDPAALAVSGITIDQISGALQANNLSVPAGLIEADGTTLPVRVTGTIDTTAGLEAMIVGSRADAAGAVTPVTLGEVSEISIVQAPSTGVSLTNGSQSIALDVYMAQGANTVDTAASVRKLLADVEARVAGTGTQVTVTTLSDQSIYIEESIDTLVREAVLGAVFAVLMILVFLLSVRTTLVTAISIPLSMLVAFVLLYWQNISLNIMTLGGLAVAVGRVVDDSIVVLESVYRHVQRGEDSKKAAYEGTKEVALAITASTLTTVAVFLPLAFVSGLIGEIFRPFALTVTFALLASLFVALTIVPVLSSYFITKKSVRPISDQPSWMVRIYEPALKWALRKPVWTLVIAFVLFVGSLGLTPLVGTSFLPSSGDKGAVVTVEFEPGSSQQSTLDQAANLEQVIRGASDVETIQANVGGSGLAAAFTGAANNRATMTVVFDESVNLNDTLDSVREALNGAKGEAAVSVANLDSGGTGGNEVSIVITGADYQLISQAATQLTEQVTAVENVSNVENDVIGAKPELTITVDPALAAANGLVTSQVATDVRNTLSGTTAGNLTIDGQTLPLVFRLDGGADQAALAEIPVAAGGTVTLGDVATIEQAEGPVQVTRIDGERAATVSGVITSEDTGAPTLDVQAIVDDFEAPEGVTVEVGGIAQNQTEAFTSLGIAIVLAIAAVYIVMVASFSSLTTPFVILFSLPLAIIGVIVSLVITGKTLGLPSLIGVLMLVGIVVTNAIVLLEFVIELRHNRGLSLRDALIEGGKTRLRPILMTAFATILALMPLALSGEGGTLIASDLAVVVIGGLITSTLLTLFVVPVIYELIGGWQDRRTAKQATRAASESEPEPEPAAD
ncbi:MAG: efflux RND transporter permease subunit [Thermomicrobiales bacterium]